VLERWTLLPVTASSVLGFLGFLRLVLIGFLGSTDPTHNLMTPVFWSGVRIAVPLGSMLGGNLRRSIDPWTGTIRLLRLLIRQTGCIGLACEGYAGFVWFQMISLSPDDPHTLAMLALI